MQKKWQLILKTPLAIFNMQMLRKKRPFYKSVSDLTLFSQNLGLFFFRTLIPVFLFPETLLAAPTLF